MERRGVIVVRDAAKKPRKTTGTVIALQFTGRMALPQSDENAVAACLLLGASSFRDAAPSAPLFARRAKRNSGFIFRGLCVLSPRFARKDVET
jgi:hypothetical protein